MGPISSYYFVNRKESDIAWIWNSEARNVELDQSDIIRLQDIIEFREDSRYESRSFSTIITSLHILSN